MPANPTDPQITHLTASSDGERLDRFLAAAITALSRTEIQRLIKAGEVQVNGQPSKPAYRLVEGDAISIAIPPPPSSEITPEAIPLDVLYEDSDLVAINKPAGMVVHPATGNREGTLINAALYHWPEMTTAGSPERPAVVHRLDKDTSGVIVLAKTTAALRALQSQFKSRTVYKSYLALVDGVPSSSEGIIDAPIARDPRKRKRMAVVRGGRPARSIYRIVEAFNAHALLSVELETGRTHQARVHLAWLGYPVAGDRVYGHRKPTLHLGRFFLHAADLHLTSPSSGQRLEFHAPLPAALEAALVDLRHTARMG